MVVELIHPNAKLPAKAHYHDLGWDLFIPTEVMLQPETTTIVRMGIKIELPFGYGAFIRDRSSLASDGIIVVGGVIDNGYRGEIKVIFYNCNKESYSLFTNEKVAQLVLQLAHVDAVIDGEVTNNTPRSEGGFGSTGK